MLEVWGMIQIVLQKPNLLKRLNNHEEKEKGYKVKPPIFLCLQNQFIRNNNRKWTENNFSHDNNGNKFTHYWSNSISVSFLFPWIDYEYQELIKKKLFKRTTERENKKFLQKKGDDLRNRVSSRCRNNHSNTWRHKQINKKLK